MFLIPPTAPSLTILCQLLSQNCMPSWDLSFELQSYIVSNGHLTAPLHSVWPELNLIIVPTKHCFSSSSFSLSKWHHHLETSEIFLHSTFSFSLHNQLINNSWQFYFLNISFMPNTATTLVASPMNTSDDCNNWLTGPFALVSPASSGSAFPAPEQL